LAEVRFAAAVLVILRVAVHGELHEVVETVAELREGNQLTFSCCAFLPDAFSFNADDGLDLFDRLVDVTISGHIHSPYHIFESHVTWLTLSTYRVMN
jgi:hypothetical protein